MLSIVNFVYTLCSTAEIYPIMGVKELGVAGMYISGLGLSYSHENRLLAEALKENRDRRREEIIGLINAYTELLEMDKELIDINELRVIKQDLGEAQRALKIIEYQYRQTLYRQELMPTC